MTDKHNFCLLLLLYIIKNTLIKFYTNTTIKFHWPQRALHFKQSYVDLAVKFRR